MFGELSDIKLKWKHKIKIWSSNIYLNWPWGYSCWQAIFKVVFFYSLFKPKKADESHHMYIYKTIYFCLKPLLLKNHLLTCHDFDTTGEIIWSETFINLYIWLSNFWLSVDVYFRNVSCVLDEISTSLFISISSWEIFFQLQILYITEHWITFSWNITQGRSD